MNAPFALPLLAKVPVVENATEPVVMEDDVAFEGSAGAFEVESDDDAFKAFRSSADGFGFIGVLLGSADSAAFC